MGNSNEMTIIFDSHPENEGLARVAAAAFCTQLNPTLEEVADLKTAVSEAVTNCIIHGYQGEVHKIRMKCVRKERTIYLDIEDDGIGIADVEKAMEPLYTTRADQDRSGMGFTFMEAFMDEVKVTSQVGKGTCVHMSKKSVIDQEEAWITLLLSLGAFTREIKRQEILCFRKIWDWYIALPGVFWGEGWKWRIFFKLEASGF